MSFTFGRRAGRPLRWSLPAVGLGLAVLMAPPALGQDQDDGDSVLGAPAAESVLLGQSIDEVDTAKARELTAESERITFVDLDTSALLESLVGQMELLPAVDDADASNTACRGVVPSDATIELLGEATRFVAVEASLCDHRIEGAPEVAAPQSLEWHGQVRNEEGDVLSTAAVSVLLDEAGRAGQATGSFEAQETDISLWPVDDGSTYAVYEPTHDGAPDEGTEELPSAPEDEAGDEAEGEAGGDATSAGEVPAGDEIPGEGGDDTPSSEPSSEYDEDVAGDDVAEDGVGNNGGQPRPGGRSGNRTVQVLVGYASGISSSDASLLMSNRISQTNSAFITSDMPVRAEGVGPLSAEYTQDSTDMVSDLEYLRYPDDGVMDGLETWRSVGQLDTIQVLVPDATNACGIAYRNTSVDGFDVPYAVSAIESQCALTFTHELGHTFGANHDPDNASGTTVFPWTYGHSVNGVARDVMSYDCPTSCSRKGQFSDPDDDFVGVSGTPSGTTYRNNDRAITDTSWAISEYGETDSNDFIWYRSASSHTSHTINGGDGEDLEAPYTPIAGDFDGDGRTDEFFYYPGWPRERIWWFNATAGSKTPHTRDVTGDYEPVVGDFDGDGRDDIFWYGAGSVADSIWWGTSTRSAFGTSGNISSTTISGVYTPISGDFDGDSRDDILWYAPGTDGDTFDWGQATRSSFVTVSTSTSINSTFDRPFSGDFNGDGEDDIFFFEPGSGFDALWHGRTVRTDIGPSYQTSVSVSGNYMPLSGNVDGDADGDVFWYGPSTTADIIWSGQSSWSGFVGQAGTTQSVGGVYEATIGDYNGDGYDDPFWYAFG